MLWVLRTGSPWRDLPTSFGRWSSVYTRWRRWVKAGLWRRLLAEVAREHDAEAYMLDGMFTRVHAHGANPAGGQQAQALGRSKGGLTTKLHMLCDGLGNPVRFVLTGGERQDSTQATALLGDCRGAWVIADKGYDTDALRAYLQAGGNTPVIPPKACRAAKPAFDAHLYRARHLIENLFCRLKSCRRLATRYDKTARSFAAFIALACVFDWLR